MRPAKNGKKSRITSHDFSSPTSAISFGFFSAYRRNWRIPILFFSLALLACFFASGMLAQDVQMNTPDNTSGTKNNGTVQSETNHAATPNGVIGAWNDSGEFATLGTMFTSLISWRGSMNGAAFSGGGFFTFPSNMQCIGDPAIVADSSGFFYLAGLGAQNGVSFSHVGVARSTGTMPPFSFGTATLIAAPAGGAIDKELMSIDRTGGANNNRIYMTATNLNTGRIIEMHSTALNPPAFTAWQSISPNSGAATGSMSAVAPNGDIYVVWQRNTNIYEVVKSTNGGGAYANPDAGDPAPAKIITTVANASPELFSAPINSIKVKAFPQIAIDSTAAGSPTQGYIYVVFHADPDAAGPDQADVFFTRSIDNGVTWSAPRSITSGLAATIGQDTTTNQSWNPSITVSPVNGHIYVTFYDRREDTTSGDGDPANTRTRVYRALSTDAGRTWNLAPFGSSLFVPIGGFIAGSFNNYWGEYNWSQSNSNGLQLTWGDSRNTCSPPGGATNPCSPSGRPDLDAYYHSVTNLSGPDLFIKPWGAVTGEGPTWQTSYIYVVNASDMQINASKGVINRLRARVRNLGNASASGALIHFRYAPWFAGVNDSVLKDVGPAVSVSFSAAGGGTDDQVIPIDWDLTDLSDTNVGLWPQPISAYQHFCMKVTVELASDINLSNNSAQNNFFDVGSSAPGGSSPLNFMVVGPQKREGGRMSFARVIIGKLPEGFRALVRVKGIADANKGFRLQPNEVRNATVIFASPRNYKARHDVVADITLLLDGKPSGGISARLYRSPEDRKPVDVIGVTKAPYWKVRPEDKTLKIKSEPQRAPELPPARTIPKAVKFRRTYQASYEKTWQTILSVVRRRNLGPELANSDRGLINTRGVKVGRFEIARLVLEAFRKNVNADGYYLMSIWLEPHGDITEVGIDALIASNDVEAPIGRRLPSNGTLEASILNAIATVLGK